MCVSVSEYFTIRPSEGCRHFRKFEHLTRNRVVVLPKHRDSALSVVINNFKTTAGSSDCTQHLHPCPHRRVTRFV